MPPPANRDYENPEIKSFSAPGLTEPLDFCVNSSKELKNVKISISALNLAGKSENIPSANIEISKICYLYKKLSDMSTEYILSPTYLEKFESVNIPEDTSQQFQITVNVPETLPSGIYKGHILIETASAAPMKLPVQIEILPVKLMQPENICWGLYYYGTGCDKAEVVKQLKIMKSYGMNSVPLVGSLGEQVIKDKDGNIKILWNCNQKVVKFLDSYKEAGFNMPVTWRTHTKEAEELGGKLGSQSFEDTFSKIISLVIEEGKRRGWPEMYFLSSDEDYPYLFSPLHLQKYKVCNKILKKMGVKTAIHAVNHPTPEADELGKKIYDDIDLFILSFYHPPVCVEERIFSMDWQEFRRKTREDGKKVYYYNIDTQGTHPEIIRFAYGFGMYAKDVDGIYNWHFHDARTKNIYDDISLLPGLSQFIYYYTPDDDHKGGPSIGLEAIREGIKDYKAVYTLNELIKKTETSSAATKKQIAARAKNDMDDFMKKIDFSKLNSNSCVSFPGNWDSEYYDDKGNKIISGKCKVSTGIAIEEYQNFRRKIYDYIMKLQE